MFIPAVQIIKTERMDLHGAFKVLNKLSLGRIQNVIQRETLRKNHCFCGDKKFGLHTYRESPGSNIAFSIILL